MSRQAAPKLKDLIRAARAQGWDVELAKGGHYKFRSPSGQLVVVAATTSDRRGLLNARTVLRHHGLEA